MEKFFAFVLIFLLLSCSHDGGTSENPKELTLNIATFNIRVLTDEDQDARSWEVRKSNVASTIQDNDFDVVGLQEVLPAQQYDLKNLLPDYSFYFVGRDDGTNGEAVGIAYKKSRFYPLNYLRFWLSPTPNQPSNASAWGGHPTRKRVVAVSRLVEINTRKQFYYLVTHMETGGSYAESRSKSAELIIEREVLLNMDDLPFFVAGDMNTTHPDENSMNVLRGVFNDTFCEAEEKGVREGPRGTYAGFNPDVDLDNEYRMLDYIFAKGDYMLNSYRVIDAKYDGQYPSDHLPVVINVTM